MPEGSRLPIQLDSARMTHSPHLPELVEVLADRMEPAFEALCIERYGGPIALHRTKSPSSSPSTLCFRFDPPDLPALRTTFVVQHVGGNVYDFAGSIENGPTRSFTCSLTETETPFSLEGTLPPDVAAFLLDALEQRLGRDILQKLVQEGFPSTEPR